MSKFPCQRDMIEGEFLVLSGARYAVGGKPTNVLWGRSSL